ncbi:galactose-specific lectin nattectin-like [Poecilia formosa]|uniref:galactose-specific lectin nattectin-like n=1 Tax=Poecilia formosa TaxID=48698 RepID=UPI0007BA2BBA|nr:PREDICTED: galactose-specific lectin nattectin-like [Poecilia formosa]
MASGLQLVLILGCIMMTAEAVPVPDFNNSADAPACPSGWTRFGSRCFIFYYDHKSWSDAEDFCISVGGNLASIHSYEENSFLSDMVKRATGLHQVTWAGGYDGITVINFVSLFKHNRWRWSDGSAFKYSHFAPRKPDNYGNAEDCLEINYQGKDKTFLICFILKRLKAENCVWC